jgi:hypothetical protein
VTSLRALSHSDKEQFCRSLNHPEGCKKSELSLHALRNFSTSKLNTRVRFPSPAPMRLQPDASAHEFRFDHVEGASNGREPDVDPIDDAIASEEKGWRHGVTLRSVRRPIGIVSWSTRACSQASNDIVTPSNRLRPTRDRATTRFSDASASPGHGFSFASDHKSVDIVHLINILHRIFHIHPDPRDVSRAKTHKRVFRLFEGWVSERDAAFTRSRERCLGRRRDSVCSSTY